MIDGKHITYIISNPVRIQPKLSNGLVRFWGTKVKYG
jgi:hypothetical protein